MISKREPVHFSLQLMSQHVGKYHTLILSITCHALANPIWFSIIHARFRLDIPNVEVVINFTFPLTIEDYVHRIGRTGRAGQTGTSYTFFQQGDKSHAGELQQVMKQAGQTVPEALMKFGSTIKKKEHKVCFHNMFDYKVLKNNNAHQFGFSICYRCMAISGHGMDNP